MPVFARWVFFFTPGGLTHVIIKEPFRCWAKNNGFLVCLIRVLFIYHYTVLIVDL